MIQHFLSLRASSSNVLSRLYQLLCFKHDWLHDPLDIAELATVLIKHTASFLRHLMAPVQALPKLLRSSSNAFDTHCY